MVITGLADLRADVSDKERIMWKGCLSVWATFGCLQLNKGCRNALKIGFDMLCLHGLSAVAVQTQLPKSTSTLGRVLGRSRAHPINRFI